MDTIDSRFNNEILLPWMEKN